jgi:hypothetical protein
MYPTLSIGFICLTAIILVLILRRTSLEKIEKITEFFKVLNPFNIFGRR